MKLDSKTQKRLLDAALAAQKRAYAPYSNYRVGAALLTKSGEIFSGSNIENAAYSPSICAERTAIFKAVSEGFRDFIAIAIAHASGSASCGVCRQVIREFAPSLQQITIDAKGKIRSFSSTDLLPESFGPEDLKK
ncbi:MAG: cytidine deaminase [Pseudomonadota bacterium]